MTTKKKTSNDVQNQSVDAQFTEACVRGTLNIDSKGSMACTATKVQDHTTVVIPYCKEFAQGKELLFALRSWQKYVRFGINIVVIGDREDWFSEEITFIEHHRVSDNPQVDVMEKLLLAISSPDVTEHFIWSNDDIYLVNPISLVHIEIPKVVGKLDSDKFSGTYAANMMCTAGLLKEAKLPTLNYGTHTPCLFEKTSLTAMFERFPELQNGGYLLSSVYYNSVSYPVHPVFLNWPTDQVLLPIVSQTPSESKVLEFLERKVFLNNAVSGYSPWLESFLERLFPEQSDFEG
ncbi:hypothetical protein AAE250_16235 [Bacteroides sp. GD17]|jgi:hypothetical protein|uniref:hypothetical protein n=1 Tax=Bacteroides sp. GD17 TaxID=3139826 RepID=UPI00204F7423|nr:hypothetical protein [uncultured Bacteroides sp.]DAV67191.1 MAG TPA: Stealth protein CR2, conserved region 2 [Caudoviricetes sp.]